MNTTFESGLTNPPTGERSGLELQPAQDLMEYAKAFARQKPEVFGLWCFGIGFVIGWKLKPW